MRRSSLNPKLLAILMLLTGISASAYDFKSDDGLCYNILSDEDRTVEVTYYSSDRGYSSNEGYVSGDIEIPRKLIYNSKTYTVTSIGDNAFRCCRSLTSVTIPNSVTSIGDYAFSGCSGLTSVTIPNSVTSIGSDAFGFCSKLENINVDPENTEYSSIDGILYNKDATTLLRCPQQKTSVTIPNSVTTIGWSAFYGCSSLTSVTIPNSVTAIGGGAFYACSSLTSVTIPNSVTSIGRSAFSYCRSLTSVTIPTSVTSIGEDAFYTCSSLTSVTIPNSVTAIGGGAFYACSSLTSVTIPTSVISIGISAFYGCSSLTSVTIPTSVTSIGEAAFRSCSSLTSVTIPNSVISIGSNAFYNCNNLKTVYMQCEVPIECGSIFSDESYKEALLYVPTGTIAAYEKIDPWRNFWNIEEMNFSGVDRIESDNNEVLHISINNGTLTIDGIGSHESVTVYDIHGRIVYNGTSHTIGNLSSGLYIVKAGSRTIKISI